jgi:hypothetical protein
MAGAAAGAGALLVTGATPAPVEAATYLSDSFNGLAAFVVPGNDAFSRQQKLTANRPGGVAAGTAKMLVETLDAAIPLAVGGGSEVKTPGALGLALLLESNAVYVNPLSVIGPFSSPFANLTFTQKRQVLQELDGTPYLNTSSIGYATNAISTLAALGAYSEIAVYNRRTKVLSTEPLGWGWTNYGGVSDGWPELIGYYQGRTEVTA